MDQANIAMQRDARSIPSPARNLCRLRERSRRGTIVAIFRALTATGTMNSSHYKPRPDLLRNKRSLVFQGTVDC